jgi:hypothetical protein
MIVEEGELEPEKVTNTSNGTDVSPANGFTDVSFHHALFN